jgi:hypothetical protein
MDHLRKDEAHWDDVAGVWQRVSLEVPTGTTTDVASAVWWIQSGRSATPGPRLFADIRIPHRPPAQAAGGRGSSVSIPDILRQRASAGVLECVPLDPAAPLPPTTATPPTPVVRCTWHCHVRVALFLETGPPDPNLPHTHVCRVRVRVRVRVRGSWTIIRRVMIQTRGWLDLWTSSP